MCQMYNYVLKESLCVKQLLAESIERVNVLETSNKNLQEKVNLLQNRLCFDEQRYKDDSVEISNIPELLNENATSEAMIILNEGLHQEILIFTNSEQVNTM